MAHCVYQVRWGEGEGNWEKNNAKNHKIFVLERWQPPLGFTRSTCSSSLGAVHSYRFIESNQIIIERQPKKKQNQNRKPSTIWMPRSQPTAFTFEWILYFFLMQSIYKSEAESIVKYHFLSLWHSPWSGCEVRFIDLRWSLHQELMSWKVRSSWIYCLVTVYFCTLNNSTRCVLSQHAVSSGVVIITKRRRSAF